MACSNTVSWVCHTRELNIPEGDVEQLLVSLILDSRIAGHIDQVLIPRPLAVIGLSFMVSC